MNFVSRERASFLRQYLWPVKERIVLLLLLLLVSIALQAVAPQLMRRFLDQAQAGVVQAVLVGTAVFFLIATVAQKIIYLVSVYLSQDLGWRATNQLRLDLTNHILSLDMGFHKLKPAGELIERIDGDISNLAEYFSDLVVAVFANVVLAVVILLLLFREDWRVGLVGVGYALAIFVVLRLIQNRIVGYWRAVREAFAQLFGFVEERLGGLEDIRANGGDPYVLRRLATLSQAVFQARVRGETVGQISFMAAYMFYAIALATAVYIGTIQFQQGQMTAGTIILLITYIGLLEKPINELRREIETFQRALASIGRVQELFAIEQKVVGGVQEGGQSPVEVAFRDVSFAYKDDLTGNRQQITDNGKQKENNQQSTANSQRLTEDVARASDPRSPIPDPQPPVLQNISFTLAPQRVLGVLGRTGSGKTTLTRLLFRLYDVDEGAILFDGVDVRSLSLDALRRQVGLVTQDVQLFEATIRDNLTLFRNYDPSKSPIADAEIVQALTTLGLKSWLDGLENGLDTRLQSGGRGLSAGEAQLVALTRVFLRDPKLVILDEASSRLDPETERLLERALDALLHNRTGIIIAHRLDTVRRADDILVLENGRIAEHGERLTLLNNPESRFARLLRTGLSEKSEKSEGVIE